MTPTTAWTQALSEMKALDEFARLSGERRHLVIQAVLAYGRELLLTGNGAADQASRVVAELTDSRRLGEAAVRAVRAWAGKSL